MPRGMYKHTSEQKKKAGEARRKNGWWKNPIVAKINMSNSHKGKKYKPMSVEGRKNISKAQIGKKLTEEHRRKIGMSLIGRNVSEETRNKLREALKGRKRPDVSGEKCNFWLGGITKDPYSLEFNEDLKEVIRNRDRRKCQICDKTELEEERKLSVHHIDYNKINCNPNNLISLCHNCHIATNTHRDYWINCFKETSKNAKVAQALLKELEKQNASG